MLKGGGQILYIDDRYLSHLFHRLHESISEYKD